MLQQKLSILFKTNSVFRIEEYLFFYIRANDAATADTIRCTARC